MNAQPDTIDLGLDRHRTSPVPDVSGLEEEAVVEAMISWFLDNFEDPAHETPYDGNEGGFQYIWGGPYEAREELAVAFDGLAGDELIERAAEEIESDGTFDWAPATGRMRPVYADDLPKDDASSVSTNYALLQERLSSIEAILKSLAPAIGSFGHNNPPQDAAVLALTIQDRDELLQAVAILKAAPPMPSDTAKTALSAASARLRKSAERIASWCKSKLIDPGAKAFSTTVGAAAGVALLPQFQKLSEFLMQAADAAAAWLAR